MITDDIPRKAALRKEYLQSDGNTVIALPNAKEIHKYAQKLEVALAEENRLELQLVSNRIAEIFGETYQIEIPKVRVLGVRPREVTEDSVEELFGDYDPNNYKIRLWMRTAILKRPTAFGTFLHTLCHELCHHLDVVSLGYTNTFHTRGFFERTAQLYHHARQTPLKPLVWTAQADGTYRINWRETMQSKPARK